MPARAGSRTRVKPTPAPKPAARAASQRRAPAEVRRVEVGTTKVPEPLPDIKERVKAHRAANPERYQNPIPRGTAGETYERIGVPQLIDRVIQQNPFLLRTVPQKDRDFTANIASFDLLPAATKQHALEALANYGATPRTMRANLAAVVDRGVTRAQAVHPEALPPGMLEYLAQDVPKLTPGATDLPTVQAQIRQLAADYGIPLELAAVVHSINSPQTPIVQFSPVGRKPSADVKRAVLVNDLAARRSLDLLTDPSLIGTRVPYPTDKTKSANVIHGQTAQGADAAREMLSGIGAPYVSKAEGPPGEESYDNLQGPKTYPYSSSLIDPLGVYETDPYRRIVADSILREGFFPHLSKAEYDHLISQPGVHEVMAKVAAQIAKERGIPQVAVYGTQWSEQRSPHSPLTIVRRYQSQVAPDIIEQRIPQILTAAATISAVLPLIIRL